MGFSGWTDTRKHIRDRRFLFRMPRTESRTSGSGLGISRIEPRIDAAEIRDAELKETIEAFIALYDGWGKPDQAAEWRAELERPAAAPASEGAPAVP